MVQEMIEKVVIGSRDHGNPPDVEPVPPSKREEYFSDMGA
jgi:hypothetical protein